MMMMVIMIVMMILCDDHDHNTRYINIYEGTSLIISVSFSCSLLFFCYYYYFLLSDLGV